MVPEPIRWIAAGAGIFIVLATIGSLGRTLVVPRGESSRLSTVLGRKIVFPFFLMIANRLDDYAAKDRVLSLTAPANLLVLLFAWLVLLLIGYGLILWPLIDASLYEALRESGSSLLTLGFAAREEPLPNVVYFAAASTGLIVIALQIAYLPTMYGSFNRREVLVTTLQSRAGAPAWGPEILARHQTVNLLSNLPFFYAEWEAWAADVAESHATYPILVFFRSPHPLRSWVVGLLAVMDSAALYQAVNPSTAPPETRLCLRMGFTCLRTIADVLRVPYDPDPFPDDPIELTYEEFHGGVRRLEEAGWPMERTPEEAWPHFQGWRVNYEQLAYAFADLTVAPPGPWSGPRQHLAGMTLVPQRPADRRPEDPTDDGRPKADRTTWRA